jgi:23S rRNA-/tRNA-specific pseudouridylate synthase
MDSPVILHESPDWLALAKPAGWLTIPGRPSVAELEEAAPGAPVLVEWARERHGPIWVVHRLDRETSGVLLFARNPEAHRRAGQWFQKHEVRKVYDCLAAGVPAAPTFKINSPIADAPSATQVEVVRRAPDAFLARVRPLTGRRHQIRIHLSRQGYPIWGDAQYGGEREPRPGLGVGRVALHAARLELPDGSRFEAPWPADFGEWVEELSGGRA